MEISIWKMFTIFGIVSTWAAKALADNKVTLKEAAELVEPLCEVLGVPTEIEVSSTQPDLEDTPERDPLGKIL